MTCVLNHLWFFWAQSPPARQPGLGSAQVDQPGLGSAHSAASAPQCLSSLSVTSSHQRLCSATARHLKTGSCPLPGLHNASVIIFWRCLLKWPVIEDFPDCHLALFCTLRRLRCLGCSQSQTFLQERLGCLYPLYTTAWAPQDTWPGGGSLHADIREREQLWGQRLMRKFPANFSRVAAKAGVLAAMWGSAIPRPYPHGFKALVVVFCFFILVSENLAACRQPLVNLGSLCCLVAKSCPTLCDLMYCMYSMPGIPVLNYLLEFGQTHVHWVNDDIQPSHSLLPPSPPTLNPSQNQSLFQWVALHIRWPKYWSFSFSMSPPNEDSGLISLSPVFLKRSLVFPILLFSSILCIVHLRRLS